MNMNLNMTRPSGTQAALAALQIASISMVIVVVNILIYRARHLFIQWHPEFVAQELPTISRAISDPRIGEPFAVWMAVSAPLLVLGVAVILWFAWRDWRLAGQRGGLLPLLLVLVLLCQIAAACGMVILSQFRFPDHRDAHMAGSYLFFIAQALTVVLGGFISRKMARLAWRNGMVFAPANHRLRWRIMGIPVLLVLAYLALFIIKDFDIAGWDWSIHQAYVWTEPATLSSFLIYVGLFHLDAAALLRRYFSRSAA